MLRRYTRGVRNDDAATWSRRGISNYTTEGATEGAEGTGKWNGDRNGTCPSVKLTRGRTYTYTYCATCASQISFFLSPLRPKVDGRSFTLPSAFCATLNSGEEGGGLSMDEDEDGPRSLVPYCTVYTAWMILFAKSSPSVPLLASHNPIL